MPSLASTFEGYSGRSARPLGAERWYFLGGPGERNKEGRKEGVQGARGGRLISVREISMHTLISSSLITPLPHNLNAHFHWLPWVDCVYKLNASIHPPITHVVAGRPMARKRPGSPGVACSPQIYDMAGCDMDGTKRDKRRT